MKNRALTLKHEFNHENQIIIQKLETKIRELEEQRLENGEE